MEIRGNNGKGPLLLTYDPETQTVCMVRKNLYYEIQLGADSYCIRKECDKHEMK